MESTIKLITDFLFIGVEDSKLLKNDSYDIVIVCGNDSIKETIDAVEEIYKIGKLSPKARIVLSGNVGSLNFDKSPEAHRMLENAKSRNIPEELFLIEDKASNSRENFEYSKQLLESNFINIDASKILVICKSFLCLRAKMSAAAVGFDSDRIEFLGVVDKNGRNIGKETWFMSESAQIRVFGEIERIGKYASKKDISIY